MLPIRDDNPHFLTPVVTRGLIAANVLVWIFVQGMGSEAGIVRSICSLGLIPAELLQMVPAGTPVPLGEGYSCVIGEPAWYTPLTSMFLQGGWLHILGNMWFLWIFGNNIEDSMGHLRFLIFYILSGLAAAFFQIAANPDSALPMVGASGAIAGVMGAYLVLYPRVRVHVMVMLGFFVTTVAVPAVFMLGYWFLLQVISGFVGQGNQRGGVAFWAHVGGFVFGALAIAFFRKPEMVNRHPSHGWRRSPAPGDLFRARGFDFWRS